MEKEVEDVDAWAWKVLLGKAATLNAQGHGDKTLTWAELEQAMHDISAWCSKLKIAGKS